MTVEEVDLQDVIESALKDPAPEPDGEVVEEQISDEVEDGDGAGAALDDDESADEPEAGEADEDEAEEEADEEEADDEEDAAEVDRIRQERDELLRIAAHYKQLAEQQGQQQPQARTPAVPPVSLRESQPWLFPSDEAEDRAATLFHANGAELDSTDEGKKALAALGLSSDQIANAKRIAARRKQFWSRAMSDPRVLVQEFVMPAVQQHLAGVMGPIQAERDEVLRRQFYEAHGFQTAEEQAAVTQLVRGGMTPEGAALKVKYARSAKQLNGREKKVKRRERDQEARKRGRRRSAGKRPKGAKKNKPEVNVENMSLSDFLEHAVDAAGLD